MIAGELIEEFRKKIRAEVEVEQEGIDRFIVYTPFMFDDGDHFVILLKRQNGAWYLSDEGHTLMHISYRGLAFDSGKRKEVIEKAITLFGLEDAAGELRLRVPGGQFGDALFSFVQALMKIADATYWTFERAASAFYDELRAMLEQKLGQFNPQFDYVDQRNDSRGSYPVDCFLNCRHRPVLIFGIKDEGKLLSASVTIREFRSWGLKLRSIGIFEDQTKISAKKLPMFTDVADKPFSSLAAAEVIGEYVSELG